MKTPTGAPSATKEEKNKFKKKLGDIFAIPIGDDLIKYFDDRLDDVTVFLEELVSDYEQVTTSENLTEKTPKEIEDEACKHFGIQNVNEVLDTIANKQQILSEVDEFINSNTNISNEVFIPPDKKTGIITGSGVGMEKAKIIDRLRPIFYLLKNQGIILTEDNKIEEGTISNNMFRDEPYFFIPIPQINRVVLDCNQKGNVMFVFDMKKLIEKGLSARGLVAMSKSELENLILENIGIGKKIPHSLGWEIKLREALFEEINFDVDVNTESKKRIRVAEKIMSEIEFQDLELSPISESEIDPWKGFAVDRFGRHWGNVTVATRKLFGIHLTDRNETIFSELTATPKSFYNRRKMGQPFHLFCFEEIEEIFSRRISTNPYRPLYESMDGKDEWKNFQIVGELHYSTQSEIKKHLEAKYGRVYDQSTFSRLYLYNPESIKVIDNLYRGNNLGSKIFCLEDYEKLLEDSLTRPIIKIDENGLEAVDIGGVKYISLKSALEQIKKENPDLEFEISKNGVENYLKRRKIKKIFASGSITRTNVFLYEEIMKELKEYFSVPKMEDNVSFVLFDGENYGTREVIYDELLRRFPGIKNIRGKGDFTKWSLNNFVQKYSSHFKRKKVRMEGAGINQVGLYCLEDIIKKLREDGRIN